MAKARDILDGPTFILYSKELEKANNLKLSKGQRYRRRKKVKIKYGITKSKKQKKQLRKDGIGGKIRTWYLYALECEHDMYYVGITAYKDAVRRFEQHKAGEGARWTMVHKPLRIIEVRCIGRVGKYRAELLEQEMTLDYIKKYGARYVRGGKLCNVNESSHLALYNKFSRVTITKPAKVVDVVIPYDEEAYARLAREEW